MLKPQKRHSQTLSTKKPKPIEITLTKKPLHINSGQTYGQENLNQSTQKVLSSGLSLVRPLRQKSQNITDSHALNLKQLKSKQLKLKQEICPSYQLNWGSTPINNSSRASQTSNFLPPQENTTRELNHLLRTVDYKKYTREVHDTYVSNAPQFNTNIQASSDVVTERQPILNRQKMQIPSINSVKSKIKGLTKGFLRDGKNASQNIQNREQKSDQILKEIIQMDQNQSSIFQQLSQLIELPNLSQNLSQSNHHQAQNLQKCQSPQKFILIEENLTQRSALKQHYAVLSERLQQCVEQIVEIQKNNSVQKIVELENEILTLKECHQSERLTMQNRIAELQQKLALSKSQVHISNKETADSYIQTDLQEDTQVHSQTISTYQTQVHHLTQKVTELTQLLHSQSFQHDQSFSQQGCSSLEIQNQIYDMDIMKRKYTTLQQVLQSKKKEIANKDAIIQMLLNKQVEKNILQNESFIHSRDRKDKVKQLVFEMFGYMNGKLANA